MHTEPNCHVPEDFSYKKESIRNGNIECPHETKNEQIWLGLGIHKSSHFLTPEQQAFEQHHQSHFQICQPDQKVLLLLHAKSLSSIDEQISQVSL